MPKPEKQIKHKDRVPLNLALIFIALSLGIILLGLYYYTTQKEDIISRQEKELSTISDYKAQKIETWLNDRIRHANSILVNQYRINQIRLFLKNPDAVHQIENLSEWFQYLLDLYNYSNVTLFDNNYNPLISVPQSEKVDYVKVIERIRKYEPLNEVKISGLHQNDSLSPIHICIYIPVKYTSSENNELNAVLVFGVDIQSFVFPALLDVPTPYNTMESLMAQKDEDSVLFLNDLKYKQHTALMYKIPLTEKDVIAVQASDGKEGITYGKDYRDKEVLACIHKIKGTSWFLITKIDLDEINAPILRRTLVIFLNVLFGIILTGIVIGFIWRNQKARHYRLLYQKEVESKAMAEHYAYLTKYANDIILLHDKDLYIIEANDKALETYGYTREEFLKLNVRDLRVPEQAEGIKKAVEYIKIHGGVLFETEHKRKDGSRFPVEPSVRLINIEGKEYYQSIIRDISERKKNEEIIKKNEILTNAVIQNSPVGITIRSVSGELVEYNKAWMDIWGLDKEKVNEFERYSKNKTAEERYSYFGKYTKNIKNAFENGESCFIPEIKIKNPYSGKEIYLSVYLYALKSNGKTERIVTLTTDITEEKKAVENLKESEEKHRSIIEHSTVLFYTHTPDHVLTYFSPQTREFFDCEPEEALINWTNFATGNPVNELGYYLTKKAIETGESQPPYELELKGKKGRVIWVEVNESPIVVDGKTAAIVGSLTDITSRKKAEEKIHKLNRAYRILSEINQTIVRVKDINELLKQICEILVLQGKFKMVWFAEIDFKSRNITPLAICGDSGKYVDVLLSYTSEILNEENYLLTALRDKEIKVITESNADYNKPWRKIYIKQNFKSHCFVPIKEIGSKHIMLSIYTDVPDYFDEEEIKLLNELSADISFALENFETENLRKTAEDALNKTTNRLKLLFDTSSNLNKSLDLNVIYTEIYKFISGTMECDSFIVSNFDSKEKLIKCSAAWFEGTRTDVSGFPVIALEEEGKGTQSRVIRSGKSMIINDYPEAVKNNKSTYHVDTNGSILTQIPENAERTRSALVVPLKIEDRVIGVVQVLSYKNNSYTQDDLSLFESLTFHASSAIHNATLYLLSQNEIKERKSALEELKNADYKISKLNRLYRVTSEISQSIVRTKDENELFKQVCRILVEIGNFKLAWIAEHDLNKLISTRLAVSGYDEGYSDLIISNGKILLSADNPHFDKIKEKKFLIFNDLEKDLKFPWRNESVKRGYNSLCIVPLSLENKRNIALNLYSAEYNFFNKEEIELLNEIAADVSFALNSFEQENLRVNAEEALKNSKEQIQILYETSENLNRSLNIEYTYEVIIDFVSKFMDCEGLIVSEYNSKEQKIYYNAAWIQGKWIETDNIMPIDLAPEGKGMLSRVIRSEKSLIINDYIAELKKSKTKYRIENGKTFEIDSNKKDVTRSALMVPLKIEGKVIGVMHVISFRENAYTEEHKKLLESISVHISSAINNANLYKIAREEINERKKSEDELRRSEERFALTFKLSPYPTALTRLSDFTFLDVNEEYTKLLGLTYDEIIGLKTDNLMIADKNAQRETRKKLEETSVLRDVELQIVNKKGEVRDTLSTLQKLNIRGEECVLAMIEDITDKKKSEEQLRKLSRAVNQSPASIVITDIEGNIEYVNAKFSEVTGYIYKETIGQNPRILKSGETPDEVYKELWQTIKSGFEWHGELHNKKKNGELFWEWASISPIIDASGKITNYLAVKEDITVQKIIQEQIRLQAVLIENITDAVISVDKNFNVKSWNPGAEKIYGWNANEVVGKNLKDFLNTEYINDNLENVLKFVNKHNTWFGEVLQTTKKGSKLNILVSSSVLRNEKGELNGYVSVNRDITERKQQEEKIKTSLKEKEILLKEIHHRVKNNLQVISSLLKIQSDYITDPVALEYFRISSQRVKSMALIHEQLYRSADLSKIDFFSYVKKLATHLYQTYGINMGDVKLNVYINDIKLSIDTAIPCGLLINELISNSLKHGFSEGGKGKIDIEMTKDKNRYILIVRDNGAGFPDNIDFRNTDTLGMQLINTLTEQIDGNINLKTKNGTEFIITFKADEYKLRI